MADLSYAILNKINALREEINTDLANRPVDPSTITNTVAWVKRGGGKVGETAIYPMEFFPSVAQKRTPFEDLPKRRPEVAQFSVAIDEWAPDGRVIPRFTEITDLYGIFENIAPTMLAQAQITFETQLAQLMGAGQATTTVYDNKNFFAIDHEANPNRLGLATFSNFRAGLALDRAGLITALDALDAFPGPDGQPLYMPGENWVVCSTEDQYQRALLQLNAQFIPSTAGTATQSNTLIGRAKAVKLVPLRNFDTAKGWYVVKIASEMHRPFHVRMPLPPELFLDGLAPNDFIRYTKNVGVVGWRAVWGYGYLWPHLAIKAVEP